MSTHSDSPDPNAETVIRGSSGSAGSVPPDDPGNFPTVPGYELLRQLHHGGQGVVYEARQKATRRTVAIKFMHAHAVGSESERARFEREVQILGQLRHPGIISIHDSGMAHGSFYFVMDFIAGHPLDTYLAEASLTVREKIDLFAEICDAVHAAHLAGVIHRDLKPNNILVDEEGQAHVLDFGLAKVAIDETSDLTAQPAMTMTGQFFGSLPWASPEQAEAVPSKIDLRSDVYSLGVILYQLLTGRFPYDVTGNMRDTMENILHAEPRPPSSVAHEVDDELETITLKCLSKERDRRYQIAGEVARDIRHYLSGEPIEAKRDSGWYVLRKTLRRYRGPVLVSAAFLVILLGSLIFTATAWRIATQQRDLARTAEAAKQDALTLATEQAELARIRAAEATRYLHAIQVGSAFAAVQRHDWVEAERLLAETSPRGEMDDLRSFAWQHVAHRVRGHAEARAPTPTGARPEGETLRISPDSSLLMTWHRATLHLYAADGTPLRTFDAGGPILDAAFSPDGRRCAVALPRRLLSLSVEALRDGDRNPLSRGLGIDDRPTAVAIDNDGLMAFGTQSGTVYIVRHAVFGLARDLFGSDIEACPEPHTNPIRAVTFQSEGNLLASVSWERRGTLSGVFGDAGGVELKVYRAATLRESLSVSVAGLDPEAVRLPPPDLLLTLRPQTKLTRVAFSPTAPILAAWGGSYIRVWSLRLIEQTTPAGEIDYIAEASPLQVFANTVDAGGDPSEIEGTIAAWSADGERLLCGDKDGHLRLFDVTRNPNATAELHEVFGGRCRDGRNVEGLAFAANAPAALVVSGETVQSWNLTAALPYIELPGAWNQVAFDQTGHEIWTLRDGGLDRNATLGLEPARVSRWQIESSRLLASTPLRARASELNVQPDGVWLPLADRTGLLWLDPRSGQPREIDVRPGTIGRFSPRGDLVLALESEPDDVWQDVRLFQADTGQLRAQPGWKTPARSIRNARFSADGVWLLAESPDGAAGWTIPVAGGRSATITPPEGTGRVRLLAGHGGANLVAGLFRDGPRETLWLRNVIDGRRFDLAAIGSLATVESATFSPTGRWIAVAGNGTNGLRLQIWNANTHRLALETTLPRDIEPETLAEWCAFTPDEQLVAIPGGGQIRLIDLLNGQDRLRLRVEERTRSLQFAPDGTALAAVLDRGQTRIWLAHADAPPQPTTPPDAPLPPPAP